MKLTELRQKNTKELRALQHETDERLRTMRFDLAAGRGKNVKEAGTLRRTIARVHTIISEGSHKK